MSADRDRDPMRDEIAADLDKLGSHARATIQAYRTAFDRFANWATYRDEHARSYARTALEHANDMMRALPKTEAHDAAAIDRALTAWVQSILPALDHAKRRHR